MDYSLLIKIEKMDNDQMNAFDNITLSRNQFVSQDMLKLYHIGIIDYLQEFSRKKKVENFTKTIFKSKSGSRKISCVPPQLYGERFVEFMIKEVFDAQKTYDFGLLRQSSVEHMKNIFIYHMYRQLNMNTNTISPMDVDDFHDSYLYAG